MHSSLTTKSKPIIFLTFVPIYKAEKSKIKKYYFKTAIKTCYRSKRDQNKRMGFLVAAIDYKEIGS